MGRSSCIFSEKFDQGISDYEAALELKSKLLPISSRQIAEVRYKLAIVLDMTSGRLADSIEHAEKALESIDARLAELRSGLDDTLPPLPESNDEDAKGKGKERATTLRRDLVQQMSKSQIEAEIKELDGLRTDVALKVCCFPSFIPFILIMFSVLG
jgi:HAT1-interacting factor 1